MNYKIPEKVFHDFEYIGGRNYSTKDHKHIETLAYLIGEEESSNTIVVKELVYPDQDGQNCHVISKCNNIINTYQIILYMNLRTITHCCF